MRKQTRRLQGLLSIEDFERRARRVLPASIFAFVAGGAESEAALRGNLAAYRRWRFLPRVLIDISRRSTEKPLFEHRYGAPFGIAPTGVSALCCFEADLALARAAHAANIPFILSGASTTPLERVMAVAPGTWFQAYIPADQDRIAGLLARLDAAGVETLVVTVDVPLSSLRENEVRQGFSVPLRPSLRLLRGGLARPRWLCETFGRTLVRQGIPRFENLAAEPGGSITSGMKAPQAAEPENLTWADIAWLRTQWRGRLIVKGIVRIGDAKRARAIGVDGIILSNHGGRQLDHTIAPLDALPGVRQAVPDLPVMIDGGIRRGTDVLKALALGADFVFAGRPFTYGIAIGGQAGVALAVEVLRRELDTAMALSGCPALSEIGRDIIMRADA